MIAVCLAPADLHPHVDELTGEVSSDPRRAALPAAESTALEHALRAASAWGGWVLAVTCGARSVEPALVDVAALGVSVARVEPSPDDPAEVASLLASAIGSYGEPSLVLCGDRSAVRGIGVVPGFLAHELGLPHALGLVALSVSPHGTVLAERRLDGGWRERLLVSGPAVLSVEGGSARLRRAPLSGVLEAGPVETFSAPAPVGARTSSAVLGVPRPYRPRTQVVPAPEGDTRDRLLALTGALVQRQPARVIGPVDPAGAAEELLAYLARIGVHT